MRSNEPKHVIPVQGEIQIFISLLDISDKTKTIVLLTTINAEERKIILSI